MIPRLGRSPKILHSVTFVPVHISIVFILAHASYMLYERRVLGLKSRRFGAREAVVSS